MVFVDAIFFPCIFATETEKYFRILLFIGRIPKFTEQIIIEIICALHFIFSLSHSIICAVADIVLIQIGMSMLVLRLIFAPKNGDEHEPTPFTMYNSLTCHIFNVRLKQQMIKSSICFAHPPCAGNMFSKRNGISVVKNAFPFFSRFLSFNIHRINECLRRRSTHFFCASRFGICFLMPLSWMQYLWKWNAPIKSVDIASSFANETIAFFDCHTTSWR